MNLIQIAFRNLGRNRSRTALSIIAVTVGVFVVILAKGTIDGMLGEILGNTIKFSSGHVRVIDREYEVKERLLSLNYPVDGFDSEGYQAVADAVENVEGVDFTVPRLRFGAMVAGREEVQGVMGMGVDPQTEEKLVHFSRYMSEGRFIQPGEREAAMGYQLLERLNLKVGDRFTLVFNTALGSMKGYTFTIVGSIKSGLPYLDRGVIFVPLTVAQDMLDMGSAVTDILVMAESEGRVPQVLEDIRTVLEENDASGRYTALPWYNYSGMIETLRIAEVSYHLIYLFILFLSSFVVINTMVMVVNERRREIGMLSAMGLRPGQILRLFLYEGAITGAVGSVLGVALGSVIVLVLGTIGITLPGVDEIDPGIMIAPKLYPVFNLEVILFALLAGFVVTTVAVYGPAKQAGKMKPTEALRV